MSCTAPSVALIGPRQAGKTTLALEVAKTANSVYLDLESHSDRARLTDAELYLSDHEDRLVISVKGGAILDHRCGVKVYHLRPSVQ